MADERKMDRRALYTQKAIKDAFLRVKRNKDYNMITVADICREAEISRGTFQAHFSNIAEVLDTLLDEALANMDYLWESLFLRRDVGPQRALLGVPRIWTGRSAPNRIHLPVQLFLPPPIAPSCTSVEKGHSCICQDCTENSTLPVKFGTVLFPHLCGLSAIEVVVDLGGVVALQGISGLITKGSAPATSASSVAVLVVTPLAENVCKQ